MQTHSRHHVTAVAGDPRATLRFDTGAPGLRPGNHTADDDTTTYHFDYRTRAGMPGRGCEAPGEGGTRE